MVYHNSNSNKAHSINLNFMLIIFYANNDDSPLLRAYMGQPLRFFSTKLSHKTKNSLISHRISILCLL